MNNEQQVSLSLTKEELIDLLQNSNYSSNITVNVTINQSDLQNNNQEYRVVRHPRLPGSVLVDQNGNCKFIVVDAKYRSCSSLKLIEENINKSIYIKCEYYGDVKDCHCLVSLPNIDMLETIYSYADEIDSLDPTISLNVENALGNKNPNGYWRVSDENCSIGLLSNDFKKPEFAILDKYGNINYESNPNDLVSCIYIIPTCGSISDL